MPKQTTCGGCAQHVTNPSVQCTQCDLWYHLTCGEINDQMYKLILSTKESYGRHIWACRSCMSAVDSLNKKMLRMEKQINNIDQAVTKNTNDIKSTDKKLENVQKEVDTLKETIESNPVQEEVFKEINEREIRKSNIVLYNIREPEGETAETRKAEDTDEVRNIFKVINNKGQYRNRGEVHV